jgi:hypothetical protein
MDFLPLQIKLRAKKVIYALKGLTAVERVVLECTNEERWGPHGEQLHKIGQYSQQSRKQTAQKNASINRGEEGEEESKEEEETNDEIILRVLFENRLLKNEHEWRLCYKALTVVEYLINNGSEAFYRTIKEDRRYKARLNALLTFEFRCPEKGKDEGVNIRQKTKTIISLLEDEERIKQAREKARLNRGKYGGISNQDLHRTTFSSSSSSRPEPQTQQMSSGDDVSRGTRAMSNALNTFDDEDDGNDDEDGDDEDEEDFLALKQRPSSETPSFVPKVIIRDRPIVEQNRFGGSGLSLKPPPKAGNAFISSNSTTTVTNNNNNNNNYANDLFNFDSQVTSNRPPQLHQQRQATLSLDDLLLGSSSQTSNTTSPYQSAEDLFGFEINVSKPASSSWTSNPPPPMQQKQEQEQDVFSGMDFLQQTTAPKTQPAVMSNDPFSDFASSFSVNSNTNNNVNNDKKKDPLDAFDFGNLGLK